MQLQELEREATHRLPDIIAELFDGRGMDSPPLVLPDGGDQDRRFDAAGRRWAVQLKTSSGPGAVAAAAEHFDQAEPGATPVLVVPYMSPAGAKAADERGLNWIDLSGNASLRDENLYVRVRGRPKRDVKRGRPASPFAPKSARLTRLLLLDPARWWRQKDLAERAGLDPGRVSRVVRSLAGQDLLERDGPVLRARDAGLLLDAWADDYRFDRHDVITGHLSGDGIRLARGLHERFDASGVEHAFTGLPAAWAFDAFARFRLVSVYVTGDPRPAAEAVGLRRNARGANVQIIGPDDRGVFDGGREADGLPCVAPVQVYLDLGHLPERASEAADHLRAQGHLWDANG